MDYKLLIDTAALAGMIMLENGAEIYAGLRKQSIICLKHQV